MFIIFKQCTATLNCASHSRNFLSNEVISGNYYLKQNINKMSSDKIDIYALAQQDYYVLEEMIKENPKILTTKDGVMVLPFHFKFHILMIFYCFNSLIYRMIDYSYTGQHWEVETG